MRSAVAAKFFWIIRVNGEPGIIEFSGFSPAANRVGFAHIAFEVDDVAATLEAVLRHGGSVLGNVASHEVEAVGRLIFVYAKDPQGNIIELQHWS